MSADEKKNILLINSYHQGLSWTDNITKTIQDSLVTLNCNLYIEYLDAKRTSISIHEKQHSELLTIKYQTFNIDIIVVSDNIALAFALNYRDKINANAPIVFCGINNFSIDMIENSNNITGVIEKSSPLKTIEQALVLHPNTKRIFIISDSTETGLAELKHTKQELYSIKNLTIQYLIGLKTDALIQTITQLKSDDLLLLILFNRDLDGNYYSYEESGKLIVENTPCPVYSLWDFYINTGVVGGYLVNGTDQANAAVNIVKQLLFSSTETNIPINNISPNHWIFDYATLKKWNIDADQLPKDSILKNKPSNWLVKHFKLVAIVLAIMLFEALTIILLTYILFRNRRRATKQLKISESTYRMIYNFAPIGMFQFNLNGEIKLTNENFKKITGLDSEYNKLTIKDLNIPNPIEIISLPFSSEVKLVNEQTKENQILRIVTKTPDPRKNKQGIGLIEDITSQRQAQQKLLESESRYKSIFNNNHAIILLIDPVNLSIFDANSAACSFYGWDYETLTNMRISDINTASETEIKNQIQRSILKQRNHFIFEHRRAKGDTRNVEVYSGPITVNNKLLHYSIIHDITKRLEAENHNRKNSQRLKVIEKILHFYDSSDHEIWKYAIQKAVDLSDSTVGFVFTYDEKNDLFNIKQYNELVNNLCSLNMPKESFKRSEFTLLSKVITSREAIIVNDYNATYHDKKGLPLGHIPIERFLLVPILSNKSIVAILGVANKTTFYNSEDTSQLSLLMNAVWNVTKRKEAENNIYLRNQQLSETIKQKDKLISIIAHDIRNPFTTLLGMSELLSKKIETQPIEKSKRMVKVLKESMDDILNLFENLLEWALIQRKGVTLLIKPINIASITQKTLHTYDTFAKLKGINFMISIPNDILINGDERAFEMIIRNLVSNAIKYTNRDGTISINAIVDNNQFAKITISDNGIGIPPEILQTLFSFSENQPRKGTSGERGSGIGLALCYDFIILMGGHIQTQSTVGKGTTFEIYLPLNQQDR